ncbi:MAG: CarD family transcriptional regulator [Bacteriovoracaceae bacterium]
MLNPFFTLNQKFQNWLNSPENGKDNELFISGVNYQQWIFLQKIIGEQKCNFIYISPTLEESESFYDLAKSSLKNKNYQLPGLENSPYSGIIASTRNLFSRFHVLQNILKINDSDNPINLFCTYEAFLQKLPPLDFFEKNQFTLKVDDIISPHDLSIKLVELGYVRSITVEEPGSFAIKGEIFDIYPITSPPIRIHYFDELIEEIFYIDIQTNKTKKEEKLNQILIGCTPYKLCNPEFSTQLRAKLPMPSTSHKNKYELRKSILQNINNNQSFENFASYISLFFEKYSHITHFFKKRKTVILFINPEQSENYFSELLEAMDSEYEMHQNDKDSDCILPTKDNFYFTLSDLDLNNLKIKMSSITLNQEHNNLINASFKPFNLVVINNSNLFEYIKNIFQYIKHEFDNDGEIFITYKNSNSLNELNFIIESNDVKPEIRKRIQFIQFNLDKSFLFEAEKILVLSDSDFFSSKIKKTKVNNKSNLDLFAEQLATLKKGDYIIHSEHGIGQYLGLDTIEAGGIKSDFLTLLYDGNDKIYVPVYKMNLIQKYADSTTVVKLNNLNTKKFESAKERAKLSAKTLAFDLIKLQAERQSSKAFAFSPPDHLFHEFELAFPYEETIDQANAINDVIEDLQKSISMDRLVCGDVGFGKTEVAMRAAFKVVLDKKQVAILVPTTILALQHYNSFKSRFKNFAVNIEFVSRFKTAQETKTIFENVKSGKVDILIGTHKLLGSEVSFYDLGLVIIDEEQRFGVNHKEKLKLLRANVHFLTLTATPIPRTLQLAFLGLKDLSLIKTAPPNRQSIKTYIVKEDDQTLKNAIEKELARGGQVFFVHNRVQDIEIVASKIKQLVPHASIVVAHGQMTEKELEAKNGRFLYWKI